VVAWLWSTGAAATSLTLDDALARARTAHPAVRAAAADVDAARARLAQAGVLPANPVVSVDLARHSEPGNTGIDRGVSLSQEVEVGGQGRSSTRRRR
jgi:outer membrane protein TolC